MTPERIKALLFEVGAALDRAASVAEFENLSAKYRALKNKWNDLTDNALLCYEIASDSFIKSLDNSSDSSNA